VLRWRCTSGTKAADGNINRLTRSGCLLPTDPFDFVAAPLFRSGTGLEVESSHSSAELVLPCNSYGQFVIAPQETAVAERPAS
jgi:hypothetical protein